MKSPASNIDFTSTNLGTALVDRPILRALARLWEGPVNPSDLHRIELAVRAFLTAPVLVVARHLEAWDHRFNPQTPPIEYEQPFNDHLLDYEFIDPSLAHPYAQPSATESKALEALVLTELASRARAALPSGFDTASQATEFLNAWYRGFDERECLYLAATAKDTSLLDSDLDADTAYKLHWIFTDEPAYHARYLVGTHRAGLLLYADSPIANICQAHIFSHWPDLLYSGLDEEYRTAARELRGPSVGIELPPLTALLLSRSANRSSIPYELQKMRQEYEQPRNELWSLMAEMWTAPRFADQEKALSKLRAAAASIFPAAFPEKFNLLGFALSAAQCSPAGVVGAGHQLLEHNKPKARVAAVSFAHTLSKDLRKHMQSTMRVLRKHLTKAELAQFGADDR